MIIRQTRENETTYADDIVSVKLIKPFLTISTQT